MRNLKKTLAVVLAFAMILGMGAINTFAYTDVAEGTKVAEAVGILSNLGILKGYEDGTFKPDNTVTRAEMAAIICRTLGYEDQAQSSAGSTIFNDVAADHWAAGYINVAQSLQIINGYPDGTYLPENQVKYEEAVKMIVVALGYELDAQAKGGWSTGYLAVASREGITKNANGTVGAPANRGTIAVLVYNSLEVRLMDQETWTTTGGQDEYAKTDETILSQYLEVEKWEGIVTSAPFVDYAQNGYTEDADAMIELEDAFYTEYYEGKLVKREEALEPVDCSLVAEANNLVGKKVIAYIGAEEDDETGNRMVYAIAEKQGANKATTISATQLVEAGDKYWSDSEVVGYRNVGSTRINTLDMDDEVLVSVNFGTEAGTGYYPYVDDNDTTATDDDVTVNITTELLAGLVDNGTITFISNDANSKIDRIHITAYTAEAVVEEVSVEDEMISFDCYTGDITDYDTEDEDTLVVVVKDGAVATVADIAANDTVSVVEFDDDSFLMYYVSSKTVTGKVDSYDADVVTIGGEDYEVSIASGLDTADLSGKEGIFFLNVDGQIAWEEADAAKGNYAVVLAAGETSGINGGYEIEVVLADGTVATYPLNTKAYVEDAEGDAITDKDDADAYAEIIGNMEAETDAEVSFRVNAEDIEASVYEITIKNGKVTKLAQLAAGTDAAGKDYDAENMSYGGISFNEATIIVSVDVEGATPVESDDITVGTVADFMVDGEGDDYTLTAFDEDNNDIAGLVIGFGLSTTVPQDGDAVIITSVKAAEVDDNDAYVITGLQGGKEVTYTICDEDEDYTGDTEQLVKGSIILVGVANAEGIVADFEVLYTVEDGVVAADDTTDEIYYVAGSVDEAEETKPTSSKFFIVDADNAAGEDVYYDAEDGIVMKASANYTLVDYSESATNPEVSKKSKGTSIFGTLSKYDSEVFVRYYDDSIVEIVVYRYAE